MFSVRLKNLRERDGLSQIRFSEEIGFSQSAVSAWENNTREPGIEALIKIARFFNTSIDYLVDDIQEKRHFDNNTLSNIESTLIENYRKLPDDLQERARLYMQKLVELIADEQQPFTQKNTHSIRATGKKNI